VRGTLWAVVQLLAVTVIGASLVLLGGAATFAWSISGRVRNEALRPGLPRPPITARVVDVGGGRITLVPTGRRALRQRGVWGLRWDGGYSRVVARGAEADGRVVFEVAAGAAVPGLNTICEFDAAAYPDPPVTLARRFREVHYPAPVGEVPAWLLEGTGEVWAVTVHGQSQSRLEPLRLAESPPLDSMPTLVVSYRNDPGVARSSDGDFHFGDEEWADLEAGASYAVSQGARSIVLTGHSMGAGIALRFMERSPLARRVRALIFDSPMLDLRSAVKWTGRTTGVPSVAIPLVMGVATRRFGIDWSRYDLRSVAEHTSVPMLLLHGDRDGQTPVSASVALAARSPESVSLERFSGAGHCQSWNEYPDRYGEAVRAFLAKVLEPTDAQPSE
jgi:dienelactone hydrolase